MKHQRLIKGVRAILEEEYGSEESERIADWAQGRYLQLCRENHNDSKALKQHTFTRIYPAVAVYETMRKYGIPQEKAVWYVREYFIRFAAETVPYLQKLIAAAHAEKIIPALFRRISEKGFPPEAGFAYEFPPAEKNQARFNILSCPYMKTCQKYGCPELCTAFCDGDDAGYGDLHRNLRWGRTKTIGRGDDCCNFLLEYVRDTGSREKSFQKELQDFLSVHQYSIYTAAKGSMRYILAGDEDRPAMIFFNGLELQETWIRYVSAFEKEYRVLMIEYPLYAQTMDEFLAAVHDLLDELHISSPAVAAYSDGGLHAQLFFRRYPDEVRDLILMSTLTIDSEYCEDIIEKEIPHKNRYRRLFRMIPSALLNKVLVSRANSFFHGETEEEQEYGLTYLKAMAETGNYRSRFLHSLELLWDGVVQPEFTREEFEPLRGHVLLLQPQQDIFSREDQERLASVLPDPQRITMRGGHLSVIMCADDYIKAIREFLKNRGQS